MRYCALPFAAFPLDRGSVLVRRFDKEQPLIVESSVAEALKYCGGLRTIDDHIGEIDRNLSDLDMPGHSRDAILKLISAGLLVDETEISREFLRPEPQVSESQFRDCEIAIVTKDRCQTLRRTVESIIRHGLNHDRTIKIAIYDDSQESKGEDQNILMLKEMTDRGRCVIRYANKADRRRYASELCRAAGVEEDVARFALLGLDDEACTIGANRNSALLDIVDCPCLFIDDDVVLRAQSSPSFKEGIRISSGYTAKSEFYDDLPTLFGALVECEQFVPDLHQNVLGTRIHDRISDTRKNLLSVASDSPLWRSVLERRATVPVTQMGIIGDSAQGSRNWILSMGDEQRKLNLKSEADYLKACTTSYVRRVVDAVTLTDSAFCMTYATAVANIVAPPPFFSFGRNSDGIFGVASRITNPHGHFAHLPYEIMHQRPAPVSFHRDAVWLDASRVTMSDILILVMQSYSTSLKYGEAERNYGALGEHLMRIANLGNRNFRDLMRQMLWKKFSKRIAMYEELLDRFEERPAFWANDVRRAISEMVKATAEPMFGLPYDGNQNASLDDRTEFTRYLVHRYGLLLKTWIRLRKFAESGKRDTPAFRVTREV